MGKEDLRSGLEGWIRNTREVAQDLGVSENASPDQESPPPAARRPSPPAPPPTTAAALVDTLRREFRSLAENAHRLKSLEAEADPTAREALAFDLVDLARTLAPQIVASSPAPEGEAPREEPRTEVSPETTDGILAIPGGSFRTHVLDAEVPVLVELHLDGYGPCEKAQKALAGVAAQYEGPVDLRTLNVMEAEPEVLPQIVKVGRDFFDRNLPKVLLYQHGQKLGEVSGEVSTDELVELLRSEVRG